MLAAVDQVLPTSAWAFNDEVTRVFDDMLTRSIPQYPVMRHVVTGIAKHYAQRGTHIVDLGCSRGDALAPLVAHFPEGVRFVGAEMSEPMINAAKQRFEKSPQVDIVRMDLRTDYPDYMASVTMAVLTIQFTPIEYRHKILRRAFEHTLPGGAFILVEKILGASAQMDDLLVKSYYDLKAANGYSQEQIERKRLSLEGVLVPVTARWNEELLATAGFRQIECCWRWMNFAAWVAVRE